MPQTFEEWSKTIVGKRYRSMGRVYLCTSYDPAGGFWMRSVDSADPRETCISERAIGRTYHEVRMTPGAWRLLLKNEALGRFPTQIEADGVLYPEATKTLRENGLIAPIIDTDTEYKLTKRGTQALNLRLDSILDEDFEHLTIPEE